ncbi:MAG: hypothetical protein ACI8PT_001458 [Gammaproteobacteria bacterium]
MIVRRGPSFVLVVALCLTTLVYANGLSGPFVLDDFGNIVDNYRLHLETFSWANLHDAAMSSRASTLQRPLAMLSFAFNAYGEELSTFSFKATNLAIHLVNGVLVYILATTLVARFAGQDDPSCGVRQRWLASVVALVWLLHPIQLTGVLYVVQRMTSLAALFVFLGLIGFVWSRRNLERRPRTSIAAMALCLIGGAGLGLACKENAVVIFPLAALIECTAFRRVGLAQPTRRALYGLYAAVLVLPTCVAALVIAQNPGLILDAYSVREFGLGERVLTQGRVLFHYLALILVPRLSEFGIFRDGYVASMGLFTPLSTGFALGTWVVLIVAALRYRLRHPVLSFGIGWFLISHSIESSVIALELVFEHRNYLPLVGVVFAAVWYAALALQRTRHVGRYSVAVTVLVALVLGGVTAVRADIWSTSASLVDFLARRHPNSARAQNAQALRMLRQGQPVSQVYPAFQKVVALDQQVTQPLMEMRKLLSVYRVILTRKHEGRPAEVGIDKTPLAMANAASHAFPLTLVDVERAGMTVKAELFSRLADYPVTGEVSQTLIVHQRCVRQDIDVCKGDLAFIIALHEQALLNARMSTLTRAILHFSYARLLFFSGRSHAAAAHASEAIRLEPGDVGARIEYAQLLTTMGRLEGAHVVLAEIERRMTRSGQRSEAAGAARLALDAAVTSVQKTLIRN